MSSYADVNVVSLNIAALSNDVRNVFKVPTGFGGVTVLAANIVAWTAGTSNVNIVNMGAAGTAMSSTIATLGSSVYVAGVPKAFAITNDYVAPGEWIGVEEANVGALAAVTVVDLEFVMGK